VLKDRHLQTQKEFEQEKRKTQTLQEQINDKQRQLQKLQTHYDKLKRRLLLESVPSGSNLTPMGTPRSANNRHADRSLPLREESQPLRDITTAYATANTNFQHSTQSHHLHVGAGHRGKVDVLSDTSFYGSAAQPHGNSVDLKHRPSPLFFRWQSK
jgi:hypothetical protein